MPRDSTPSYRDSLGARVFTDVMPSLAYLFEKPVCHRFDGDAPRAVCGVPRSEQPVHGHAAPTFVVREQTHCPWCGHAICPRCREGIT